MQSVIAHVLGGCEICCSQLSFTGDLPDAEAPEPIDLAPEVDAAYDRALRRAFSTALRHGRHAAAEGAKSREALALLEAGGIEGLAAAPHTFKGLAAYEALLARCEALRHDDPQQTTELAIYATLVAGRLSVRRYGEPLVADFQSRAWAELGNAYRVGGNLHSAETALGRAAELHAQGTGDELLGARLFDLQASLYGDQRRFPAALAALDVVQDVYRKHGDTHLASRALLKKGLYTGYANNAEGALPILAEALAGLDEAREPAVVLWAVHNLALFLIECGRLREARTLLWHNRHRYQASGGRVHHLKLLALEAQINAGLGELGRALRDFQTVERGFAEAGDRYTAAITALHRGHVLLRMGRNDEARAAVVWSVDVFLALGIHREALAAVMLVKTAFERQVLSAALIESALEFLKRSERDPTLTVESWFL